jgi:homoserine dehydrogenase
VRILVVGTGGVGSAFARIATRARRAWSRVSTTAGSPTKVAGSATEAAVRNELDAMSMSSCPVRRLYDDAI